MGVFILWWVYVVWSFDESKFKKLLPDSALEQPILDSPEAKAFLARYPDSETFVFQDFNAPDCCEVTLSYIGNKTEMCITDEYGYSCGPQGLGARLNARLDVSADLKNITVANIGLYCYAQAGVHPDAWTVKGDIVQNLRPENPDCWNIGSPPRPSNAELISMAMNTTEGKAYLARYPDNRVSFDSSNLYQELVTLTPAITEPVQFVVSFDKIDWYIDTVSIRCSDGQYHYTDEPDLSAYFHPEHSCLESVHSKIEAANQTAQAKSFIAKYPNAEVLSGGSTTPDSNSTIQYSFREIKGGYADEARLVVIFQGQSDNIIDFEIVCYNDADTNEIHSKSGKQLDVANFLNDSLFPRYGTTGEME